MVDTFVIPLLKILIVLNATLVGVTYEDPDGERLHCWNSEIATLRAWIWNRSRRGGWDLAGTLAGPARSCFEYAQRDLLPDMPIDLG